MGIPAIQLFLIFARQMAKPVSNSLMIYGKKHPFFRNKVLIPAGRGITNLTTRLRMRDLGLGRPANLIQVSDETALEQASDILQECVLYIYGIAMFSFYYYYSKTHEKEVVTAEDLREMTTKFDEQISRLQNELETLRREKGQPRATNTNISTGGGSGGWTSWFGWGNSRPKTDEPPPPVSTDACSQTSSTCQQPSISRREAMARLEVGRASANI